MHATKSAGYKQNLQQYAADDKEIALIVERVRSVLYRQNPEKIKDDECEGGVGSMNAVLIFEIYEPAQELRDIVKALPGLLSAGLYKRDTDLNSDVFLVSMKETSAHALLNLKAEIQETASSDEVRTVTAR